MNSTIEAIHNSLIASENNLNELFPELIKSPLVEIFIESEKDVHELCHYKAFSNRAHEIANEIRKNYGNDALRPFLRIILNKATKQLLSSRELTRLPDIIKEHQCRHLLRIALTTDTASEWLDLNHDLFHKEFGIVSLRLYAAGAQLIDPRCGVPRSMILKNGILQAPATLLRFIRLGGFKPYFQIHTHKFNLDQFHEEGWEECYRGCAALYNIFPKSLGMFGASWFYDPTLNEISPRLGYLRKTPAEGGAFFIQGDATEEDRRNALSTSSTRQRLYDEGKYTPRSHMLIWGKSDQINWANKHKSK